jgi:sec-independent protein translocase protein TatA
MPFGGMELIAVLAIALIIFGPKRLPEVGRTLGKATRDLRGGLSEIENVKSSVEDVKSSMKVDVNLKPDAKAKPAPNADAAKKDAPKAT